MKKPYLIAELSCNHNGDIQEMFDLIHTAKDLGIDCVKIQSYTPETISADVSINTKSIWKKVSLRKLYKKAHTPNEWIKDIIGLCKKIKIDFFLTPYSEQELSKLNKYNIQKYKLASFEINDHKLIENLCKTKKDLIISNGMATLKELHESINLIKKYGNKLTVLHCNSGYPANFEELDLITIQSIKKIFECKVGYSDHTVFKNTTKLTNPMPSLAPLIATYLGAEVIEFHLINNRKRSKELFDKKIGGFDWAFSKEPMEVIDLINRINKTSKKDFFNSLSSIEKKLFPKIIGKYKVGPSKRELESIKFRPSLWTTKNIKKGDRLKFGYNKRSNFDSLRPSGGLDLNYTDTINNKKINKNLKAFTPLKIEYIY
ncbi:N-acetylneuraminate synthase family protein [Alphaproteobacteria bacterium]|nr:N-acetylneuraminate synthase family protein [Alphaproteobacteria bacterium]